MLYFNIGSEKVNALNFIDNKYWTSTHSRSVLNERLVNQHFYYEFSHKDRSFSMNYINMILTQYFVKHEFFYFFTTQCKEYPKHFFEISCIIYLFHDLWSHPTWGSNKCISQFLSTSICKLYHCGAHSKI